MSEKTEQFVVKTWLEEHPEHHSISLPHTEEEAKELLEAAACATPKKNAAIEPYTGQIPGQH